MAGTRSLTNSEERQLLRVVRKLSPRDRALIALQWFTGFRIREILSLTVGSVCQDGAILDKIGVAPRFLKGKRGTTRWVPVLPEMREALVRHLWWLRVKYEVSPALPLFPSRQRTPQGNPRAISRMQASVIVRHAFRAAEIPNDGRLGTHTLRKTFARKVYEHSGKNLLVVKSALGHTNVSVTQQYLEIAEGDVTAAIRAGDFTRCRARPD